MIVIQDESYMVWDESTVWNESYEEYDFQWDYEDFSYEFDSYEFDQIEDPRI